MLARVVGHPNEKLSQRRRSIYGNTITDQVIPSIIDTIGDLNADLMNIDGNTPNQPSSILRESLIRPEPTSESFPHVAPDGRRIHLARLFKVVPVRLQCAFGSEQGHQLDALSCWLPKRPINIMGHDVGFRMQRRRDSLC